MKKLYLLPLLAIVALTFNSCGNSDEPQGPTYEVFQLGLDDENIDYDAIGAWKDLSTPDTRIMADGYVFSQRVMMSPTIRQPVSTLAIS